MDLENKKNSYTIMPSQILQKKNNNLLDFVSYFHGKFKF